MIENEKKQKRKRLAWLTDNLWVLGAAIIVAALMAHAAIGLRYVQRISEGEALAYETSETMRYLSKLDNPQRRQTRTNESEARLKVLLSEFPEGLDSPATMTRLLLLAERFSIEITAIQLQPGLGNEVGTHIYDNLSIEARLEGEISSLRDFLAELEDGYIVASRLDRLDIKDITPTTGSSAGSQTSPAGQNQSMGITLLLSVFARVESVDKGEAKLVSNSSERNDH